MLHKIKLDQENSKAMKGFEFPVLIPSFSDKLQNGRESFKFKMK